MEGVYLERKCNYLGCWKDDTLADYVIRQVADMVRHGKGTKCKLHLSSQGVKVNTSSLMSGKTLKDVVPFNDIYFTTVNQYNPQCVLFITKDQRRKYRIVAVSCLSGTDASLFVSCFKDLRRTLCSGDNNLELTQIRSGNWTLRSKHHSTDKRQLHTNVYMQDVRSKQNGVIKTKHTDINSNVASSNEKNLTKVNNKYESVNRKDCNTAANKGGSTDPNGKEFSNSFSETGLRDELNDLSQELKEVKLMLETSAGIDTDVYYDKDENEIVHNDRKIEVEIMDEPRTTIEAVVVDEDSTDDEQNQNIIENLNATTQSLNFEEGEVKVVVPDYRNSGTQTTPPTYVRRYVSKENPVINVVDGEQLSPRTSTTSYDTWKEDVVLRGKIAPREICTRSAHVSTFSNDSSLQGSLRDRNSHAIYTTTTRTHHTLPHHSLRVPMRRSVNLSSTIERPIEKVYPRPRSVHGSLVYRPIIRGQKRTIYAIPSTNKGYVDKNQNKTDEHRLSSNMSQKKEDVVIMKS